MSEGLVSTTVFSLCAESPAALPPFSEDALLALDAAWLADDQTRLACHIRKFSSAGATLRVSEPLPPGDRYALELANGQHIPGRIGWSDDEDAGFLFDASIDVVGTLARNLAILPAERRRVPRVELHQHVGIRSNAGFEFARTRDLSQGGLGIDTGLDLFEDDVVQVAFHGLSPLTGTIKWVQRGKAGIAFEHELAWQTLMPWLRQAQRSPLRFHAPREADETPRFNLGEKKRVHRLDAAARVREGALWWNVQLRNVTQHLVEFDCSTPLAQGAQLWLWLPGFPGWPCSVIEADGQHYLAEFRLPLRDHDLAQLVPQRLARGA
jgi:hypothetical protein